MAKLQKSQLIERFDGSVEIQIEGFQHTSKFLTEKQGFEEFGQEGAVFRFLDGPPDRPIAVDLLCTPTHRPGHAGPGVAHPRCLARN
jgi:hypothetical protein